MIRYKIILYILLLKEVGVRELIGVIKFIIITKVIIKLIIINFTYK